MSKINLRKKEHHSLHCSENAEDFISRLMEAGIDIEKLLQEFVKPEYNAGIVLGGSIPERTATSVSDVDISILINDEGALKPFKDIVWGESVFYLHRNKSIKSNWAVLFYKGVEINFEIKIDTAVGQLNSKSTVNLNTEDKGEQRFLSRIASGWTLFNEKQVELWKEHYDIKQLQERKIISEFTLAIKELEDMKSSIGTSSGLSYVIGVHIVTRLIKSILASQDYFSPGTKWMRKVNQLIDSDRELSIILGDAKKLLFPVFIDNTKEEKIFYNEVITMAKNIESYIVNNNLYVGDVVNWVKEELDLVI